MLADQARDEDAESFLNNRKRLSEQRFWESMDDRSCPRCDSEPGRFTNRSPSTGRRPSRCRPGRSHLPTESHADSSGHVARTANSRRDRRMRLDGDRREPRRPTAACAAVRRRRHARRVDRTMLTDHFEGFVINRLSSRTHRRDAVGFHRQTCTRVGPAAAAAVRSPALTLIRPGAATPNRQRARGQSRGPATRCSTKTGPARLPYRWRYLSPPSMPSCTAAGD